MVGVMGDRIEYIAMRIKTKNRIGIITFLAKFAHLEVKICGFTLTSPVVGLIAAFSPVD